MSRDNPLLMRSVEAVSDLRSPTREIFHDRFAVASRWASVCPSSSSITKKGRRLYPSMS
jgi:hypothetical protein